ncbi:tetratricopeptide repeat protein [Dapis sp. BLCC M172]|uniref:tetratricopeptide repeat protein n=1 Tax=Dapis sp. BLCC M172 TaxID=2975281 RepID=UPI003CF5FC13
MNNKSPEKFKLAQEKASRGFLYQKQGKLEVAISLYKEALTLAPNLQFVHYNLGIIFYHQGNLSAAFTHYQQEIILNPNHIQAHYNIGIILQQQGLLVEAISNYQKVINLSQTRNENILIQVQAYGNWGSILVKEGRYNEAREILQQAITKKPDDASLYNNLGKAFLELGKVEKAIANYQQALALQPQLIVSRYNLGKAYQKQGLHSQAIVHFQEVIKQQPENIYAYSDCGFSFLELGEIEAAIPYLQKVINNNPFVESYCKQTDLLTESDELEKAKIACTKFLRTLQKSDLAEVRKNLTLIYLYLGNVLFEYGEYSQAENYYKKGLEFQPFNVELYIRLGESLVKQKRFNTAIIIYRLGLTVKPDNYLINQALEKVLEVRNNSSKISNADGVKRILNLELEGKYLSTTIELEHKDNLGKYLIPRKFIHCLNNEVFHPKTANFLTPNTQDSTPKIPKTLEGNNEKIPETECHGLNCKSCLKRIFKQLQPIHLGNGIHSFSTTEIQTSTNISSVDFPETPKFVIEVENGRAWIVPQKNYWMVCNAIAIINENNQLLAEVSREYPGQLPGCEKYDINNHQFFTTEKLPPLEQINGTVAVLSGLSGNVYFHWMVDILPRIEILRRNGINFEQIDWFLINSIQQPFQKETLRILGIPEEKIIESDRHPYIQAKKLIVPSFSGHLGWLERFALEFSRQTFLNKSNIAWIKDGLRLGEKLNNQVDYPYPERIYISRNKAKYRRVINEEKVVDLLSQYGFITIELETLSVLEQVTLFANAKVIVSPHGSGLTNIMFCQPGTTVIELVSPNYIRHYYWVISQQLGLKYYYLMGEEYFYYPIRQIMYPNPLTEDILINFSKLEKMLSQASIIKIDSQKKNNFYSTEKTSPEMMIFEKKFSNTEVDTSAFSQKQKGDNTNRTAVSDKMLSNVNLAEAAAHFHKKALFHLEQKKLDEAKAACEQAIKNQPEFAPAYKTMGIILQHQGQIEVAFEWYFRAIKIQPDFTEAYVNIGTIYAKKQQWQEAINYYKKAISLKSDLIPAYRNIVKAYQKLGKVSEAANYQYQAYCLQPEKIIEPEYINLGNTLLQQKQLTEAISCYRSALKLNPNSAVAYQNLAQALSQTGDFEESNICYQKAIKLGITNPSNINHNSVKKLPHSSSKNSVISINSKRHKKEIYPEKNNKLINPTVNQDAVEAYKQLGKMLQSQDKPAEAWQWYTKAISITPKDPEIYRDLGSLYGQQQQWQEAIKCYQKALEINPNMGDVYRYLAIALTNVGKQAKASEFWQRAYSLEPETEPERATATAEENFILGNTMLQMNIVDRAISFYCNAIKINPKLTVAYQNLGEALKLQSHAQNSNSQSQTYANHNYLKPQIYSLKDGIADKYDAQINNHQINYNELKLVTNSGLVQKTLKYVGRSFNKLVSQVNSVLNANNQLPRKDLQASANIPRLQGENNSFPLKGEIDFHIKDTIEFSIEELSFYDQTNFSNTNGNGYQNAAQKIDQTQNLSPIDQIEDTEQTAIQINAHPVENKGSEMSLALEISLADIHIQNATTYNQEGLYEKAIAECQQAIAVKPELAIAYKILGNIQQKMGSASQRQEAKKNYLKAISLDSKDASIHSNLGSLYAQEELWEQAIPCYQKAITLKPDFAGAYRNLAKAWSQVGKQAEAADCWYQAYTLQPENITPDQYLNLGNTLCRQSQFTKAISCYQRAIKLNPNYAAAYHNLAATLKRQGKLDEALIYEQKAKEVANNKVEVEVNSHKPQHIHPEDILQSSLDHKGKEKSPKVDRANLIKQAEANLANSKFYQAIATCEEIISLKPNAVAYQIMGKAWVKMNKIDEAMGAYQKSLEVQPNFPEVYISLGELYVQQQRQSEAISAYQKAIKLAPDLKDGYRNLVELLLAQGKVDEAAELSYNALIQHPSWTTPQEFCTLGNGLIEEGKTKQGITCFEQAIKLDPKLWEAYYSLGEIFSSQENWDEAVKYYRQVVELNSESIESYYALGKALTEKEQWQEAIACYEQVIKLDANKTQGTFLESENNIDMGEVYHLLGNALQEIGQLNESVAAYKRAIELTGN